jgi:hypothetical protein
VITKSLTSDRAPFLITIGDGEGKKVEVSGWVDQQKLWGIHRLFAGARGDALAGDAGFDPFADHVGPRIRRKYRECQRTPCR